MQFDLTLCLVLRPGVMQAALYSNELKLKVIQAFIPRETSTCKRA
jgi:hypothetical protein